MRNYTLATILVAITTLFSVEAVGQMLDERPNVLIIVLDDAGYNDFGFMGSSDISTPNIDSLVEEGVLLTNAFVTASVGSPSRAAILTGRYPQRSGFESNLSAQALAKGKGLNPEIMTLAEIFQKEGYNTAAIGKWHLGAESQHHPNNRGFDYFYGFLGGSRSYFANDKDDAKSARTTMLQLNGEQINPTQYLIYDFGTKSKEFIHNSGSTPFMIYLAFNAFQSPLEVTKEDLDRFKGHSRPKVAAMSYAIDKAVGGVMEQLKRDDKFDNTLIFLLSDNGGAEDNQSNAPFKGYRGCEYNGGVQTPLVVVYGDKFIKGSKYDGLSSSLDIFATTLAVAGIEYYNPKAPLDGVNLMPYLNGERGKKSPHEALYWRNGDAKAIISGDYKYIEMEGVGERLYHVTRNPQEDEDLSIDSLEQLEQLKVMLKSWEATMIDPLWSEESAFRESRTEIYKALMNNEE